MSESISPEFPVANALHRLLESEHHTVISLLHDDIGQNLVGIRSLATAILDQDSLATDETRELVEMIRMATDSAYRSSYDLMQELRARQLADQDIQHAVTACLDESRLSDRQMEYELTLEPGIAVSDLPTRAFLLRNLRAFINSCKLAANGGRICVTLAGTDPDQDIHANLVYNGNIAAEFSITELGELFQGIGNRVEAIGGKSVLELDIPGRIGLSLQFNTLFQSSAQPS